MKYIGFELLWYDAWVGFFYDQKKRILYFCPLPCCVFKWKAVEHGVAADAAVCWICEVNPVKVAGAMCDECNPF